MPHKHRGQDNAFKGLQECPPKPRFFKEEQARKRSARAGNLTVGAIVIGLLYFAVHTTPKANVITLPIAFTGTLYTVWTCAGLTSTWTKRICFFLLDIAILGMIGYSNWPRVVVSPKHVTFGPNVSFSFTVKNQTAEDVYNVSPIMRLRGTYDPKDFVIRIDTAPPLNFGPVTFPGLVCKDANGKDVLFPVIQQINAGQEARFVVTYKGPSNPELIADDIPVTNEPLAQEEAHDIGAGKWQATNELKTPIPVSNCIFRPKVEEVHP